MEWLYSNLINIVLVAAIIAVVALILRGMIRDKKAGKSSCGGNCAGCGGCAMAANLPDHLDLKKDAGEYETKVSVEGMMCGMCEAHVNDAVRKAVDVKKVSSSHSKGQTLIVTDGKPDLDAIRSAINATGYTVKDISFQHR